LYVFDEAEKNIFCHLIILSVGEKLEWLYN
jgi:hypothetical protein